MDKINLRNAIAALSIIMCFSQGLAKTDPALVLEFINLTPRTVHAIFIPEQSFHKILEAGGWTKKAWDELLELAKKIGPVIDIALMSEGVPAIGSLMTKLGIPTIDNIAGDLPEVAVGHITLKTLKKDYFRYVFRSSKRYSYDPNVYVSKRFKQSRDDTTFQSKFPQRTYQDTDLIVAVFSDKDKIADLSAPEYIGNFDRTKYNGVLYGPDPGRVTYYKKDPKTGEIGKTKGKGIFIPIEREGNDIYISEEGEELLDDLFGNISSELKEEIERTFSKP